jgi:hypothetical protein
VIQLKQMTYPRHLPRFAFAAILVFAAMLFAPTGAQAHAGHDHGPVTVQSAVPVSSTNVTDSRSQITRDAVSVRSDQFVWKASIPVSSKSPATCTGGCCHSAGHGCCAAALPSVLTVNLSPSSSTRLYARIPWGPGITPGALPEPPRSLV